MPVILRSKGKNYDVSKLSNEELQALYKPRLQLSNTYKHTPSPEVTKELSDDFVQLKRLSDLPGEEFKKSVSLRKKQIKQYVDKQKLSKRQEVFMGSKAREVSSKSQQESSKETSNLDNKLLELEKEAAIKQETPHPELAEEKLFAEQLQIVQKTGEALSRPLDQTNEYRVDLILKSIRDKLVSKNPELKQEGIKILANRFVKDAQDHKDKNTPYMFKRKFMEEVRYISDNKLSREEISKTADEIYKECNNRGYLSKFTDWVATHTGGGLLFDKKEVRETKLVANKMREALSARIKVRGSDKAVLSSSRDASRHI